ncbi:MAG: hypothetical protein ABI591_11240 [Kofleriaceae bacterium]
MNELIDLVQHRPLARDSGEELLFSAPREANLRRPAAGTQPPPMGTPRPIGLFAVELPIEPTEARATMPKISTRRQVFEPTPPPQLADELETTDVPRPSMRAELPVMVKKLALPAGIVLMISIGVGAAISMSRHHNLADTKSPPASINVAAAFTPPTIVVAPTPVVQPAPAPAHAAKLVEVRLESTPPGATATLLDTSTGNSTPLGTTPVEASVDPSKNYDVRFELEGRPSQTEHLDPAQSRIEVALVDPTPVVVASAPVVATKGKHHRHHATSAKKAATKRVATAPTTHSRAAAPPAAAHDQVTALASMGGTKDSKKASDVPGKLAVTTSVPCAILLDGANTGMTSPATFSVAAGHHSIRLIAATQHINKQVGVDVTAKKTTRVNQTF